MTSRDNSTGDHADFDLTDLKTAMTAATPRPDPGARAAHLRLAEENFAKLHSARQGSAAAPRLTPERPKRGALSGVRHMLNVLSTKGGLTVSTALVAVGFLVLTPQGKDMLTRMPGFNGQTIGEADLRGDTPTPDVGAPVLNPENSPTVANPVVRDQVVAEQGADVTGGALSNQQEPVVIAEEAAPVPLEPEAVFTDAAPMAPVVIDQEDAGQTIADGRADEPTPGGAMDTDDSDADMAIDGFASVIVEAPVVVMPQGEAQQIQRVAPAPGDTAAIGGIVSGIVAPPPPVSAVAPTQVGTAMTASADQIDAAPAPDTEAFANEAPNPVHITVEEPVSTFSIDVDTAAYTVVRQSLNAGRLPPRDAVRIEEMINYFPYDYPAPAAAALADGGAPFLPTITVMQTPWNPGTQLVHIGLQGALPAIEDRPPLNLVFLIDTSGSMESPDKLPLLRQSFLMMLAELRPEDEVAIVAYAGSAGIVLEPTPAENRAAIGLALMQLGAGGSTNGQGGLEQAYAVAESMTADGEVSRVILATDGDFNVGLSGIDELEEFIAKKRDTGTYLSVLGFGRGNLDDATMQTLAQNGNGVAAYIDTLNEAQKVLVDQLTGALFAIAGDVKVQVEFNPAVVAEYRLIGYETRALEREDFNNDAVDAGELGAGHAVTAIYEITPVGSEAVLNDPLRYGATDAATAPEAPDGPTELGFLRLRWKAPGEDESQLIETPIYAVTTDAPGTEAGFATAIAGFGQLLREDRYLGDWGWDEAIALANANRGEDPFGYRTQAVQLMRLAESLSRN